MKSKKAFSLIELSIVILIIGVLIAGVLSASKLFANFKLMMARTQTESSPVNGIKDLTLWLDATSAKSLLDSETEDGATISNWYDVNNQRGLLRNHVAQSNTSYKPTYSATSGIGGIPTIKFDGVNDYLYRSNVIGSDILRANQITIFLVQRFTGNSSTQSSTFFWGDNTYRFNIHAPWAGSIAFDFGNGAARASAIPSDNFYGTPKIISGIRKTNGYMDIKMNGAVFASASGITGEEPEATGYTLNIGAGFFTESSYGYFKGYLGEVIVFDRALTDEERNAVESYLSKKWSIPLDGSANDLSEPT